MSHLERKIPLTRGYEAIVDAEDYPMVMQFKWAAFNGVNTMYAQRAVRRHSGDNTLLHRFILGQTDPKVRVDHRDGNGLNCRRSNLRIANASQNTAHCHTEPRAMSGFRGVYWQSQNRNWCAAIKINYRKVHLGVFSAPEDAARAYDTAARRYFGDFASLNFPRGDE